MAYTPIIVDATNYHWAVAENFRLIFEELKHKVPVNGRIQLLGDLDFQNLYTVRGVNVLGHRTAVTQQPFVGNS